MKLSFNGHQPVRACVLCKPGIEDYLLMRQLPHLEGPTCCRTDVIMMVDVTTSELIPACNLSIEDGTRILTLPPS
jgi:hypothetical protein